MKTAAELLVDTARRGELHYSIILHGPNHEELQSLAMQAAKALNCLNRTTGDDCLSCQRIERRIHPDVHFAEVAADRKQISVDQIRDILENAAMRPYEGRTKVFIIDPTAASDNGTINGFTIQSQGTYTGTISVNSTGTVFISNAKPAGSHTITIRATDNCGATTDSSFTLTVGRKPVFVAADQKVKVKGAADPAFTYVASGLVGSDTLAGTLTRTVGETPGLHPITQGTVTDGNNPNYTITYYPANLIITGPFASSDIVTRANGNASSLFPVATLVANDIRIDSFGLSQTNNLSITGVTAGLGNSVSLSGTNVLYSPDNAVATAPLTFTNTLTDSASGGTDTGVVTVNTINLAIVQAGTATYNAGNDTTSITIGFSTLPNTTLSLEYSTDLTGWVGYTGNPVTSSPTGAFAVTFSAPGNQTATWNSKMFFRASEP